MRNTIPTFLKTGTFLTAALALSACGASQRLANVGQPPAQTHIVNPVVASDYQPVSMPTPTPKAEVRQPNSLWSPQRQAFFEDQRANDVGDILTVLVNIDDEAELENETERTRSSSEDAGLDNFLGYEATLGEILPDAINSPNLVGADSNSTHTGDGSIEREEEITVQLAATVTQVLPNGNLVILGRQEVRVNFENRILQVAGVIRPEDISVDNTVEHTQIAEARIVYGGEGQITDVQQPRYGQQVYDILFPF